MRARALHDQQIFTARTSIPIIITHTVDDAMLLPTEFGLILIRGEEEYHTSTPSPVHTTTDSTLHWSRRTIVPTGHPTTAGSRQAQSSSTGLSSSTPHISHRSPNSTISPPSRLTFQNPLPNQHLHRRPRRQLLLQRVTPHMALETPLVREQCWGRITSW